jgi:hypothetical protein
MVTLHRRNSSAAGDKEWLLNVSQIDAHSSALRCDWLNNVP